MCKDNFKKSAGGACEPAPSADNCITYTFPAGAGECSQCKTGFGFSTPPTCAAVTVPIALCDLYGTLTTCSKCANGKMPIAADAGATPPVVAGQSCVNGDI